MGLWVINKRSSILIVDDAGSIHWYNTIYFKQIDNLIPSEFIYHLNSSNIIEKLFSYEEANATYEFEFKLGYSELLSNPIHHDNIMERVKYDIDKFMLEYKNIVQKYYKEYLNQKIDTQNWIEFSTPSIFISF